MSNNFLDRVPYYPPRKLLHNAQWHSCQLLFLILLPKSIVYNRPTRAVSCLCTGICRRCWRQSHSNFLATKHFQMFQYHKVIGSKPTKSNNKLRSRKSPESYFNQIVLNFMLKWNLSFTPASHCIQVTNFKLKTVILVRRRVRMIKRLLIYLQIKLTNLKAVRRNED